QALDAGVASFGSHTHTVMPDPSGYWGAGPLSADTDPHPCDAYAGDPLSEAPIETVEAIVFYGASGASAVSELFGEPIRSFTGSVPRVMGNKILALSDPDLLDPNIDRDFPPEWAPWLLGGAYSECMMRATGHPPFELYHASDSRSLGGGDGPLVTPGEPVVGNMAVHLGLPGDDAPGAAMRRILTALLAWRAASLTDAPDRPWAYTFHTHLFHLYPGSVAALDPDARDVSAVTGGQFRRDLESVASFADRFTGGTWQGVSNSSGGGPIRWALPGERDPLDADFVYGDPDAAPPVGMDDSYPYPRLLAEQLIHANLVCTGTLDGVEVYGLLRCDGGWSWGGDSAGFHCTDDETPSWKYVLVPSAATCLSDASGAGWPLLQAASVVASTWMDTPWCATGGLAVPVEGLLVASTDAIPTLASACTTGLAAGG
ncbi:MAG: hypothetical protein GXP62_08025, partial [Oligoflexia bacterium]|nr:hypothetical protein [Oligoflexia bacterium]